MIRCQLGPKRRRWRGRKGRGRRESGASGRFDSRCDAWTLLLGNAPRVPGAEEAGSAGGRAAAPAGIWLLIRGLASTERRGPGSGIRGPGSGICITSRRAGGHQCNLIPTLELMMSTEEGEARGGSAITHSHTWEEEASAPRGRPHPGDEDQAQPGEEREERDEGEDRQEDCHEDRGCGDTFAGDPQESNRGDLSSEDGAVGGAACKTQAMHSSCSSDTCIPTPSCRICFQGAEQAHGSDSRGGEWGGPRAGGPVQLNSVPEQFQRDVMRDGSSPPELEGKRSQASKRLSEYPAF
ncbi:unnamed protein product [Pleuronectes platessa]|uniref:Uncharacterized protein n=1 Tax=Pleuronectes platessa TaxID=8262 RepID=A0A9N7YW34_PLEPL|nr:unnamed protein product [Pleuronectes platessa]